MRLLPRGKSSWTSHLRTLASRGLVLGLLVLLGSSLGCLGNNRQQQELLEAELRSQERHIQEMKAELDRKEGVIHSLDVEVERCQQAAAKHPGGEPAPVPNVVKDIVLGRFTGGIRENPKATFDDALLVVLEPRDVDGHALKAPGSVHIDLFEITPQGLKTPLSAWDITHRELRRLWDEPLIGGPSYRITLPWKALPTTERLRVVARFTTLDGKLFEAERDISIRLPPGVSRPGLPVGVPGYCPPPIARSVPDTRPDERLAVPKQLEPPSPPLNARPSTTKTADIPAGTPVIELPPREFPSTGVSDKQSEPPGSAPSLPPPPAVPTLNDTKETRSSVRDKLPPPRTTPQTDNPIPPGTTVAPTHRTGGPIPLTAPPPLSWRARQPGLVQVSHSDEPTVRLARPVPASAISDR